MTDMTANPRRQRFAWFLDPFAAVARDRFALGGLIVLGLFFVIALFAPMIATHDPFASAMTESGRLNRLARPSAEHLLGTTTFGHDVFSQFILGFRVALLVGLLGAFAVGVISTLFGVISGYFG